MRFVGFFRPDFMKYFWTTIGNTIYYPTNVVNPHSKKYNTTIKHELVHVAQYEKHGKLLFLFLYVFFPLPVFFSYYRWKFEREAYLVEIKSKKDIDFVVDLLHDAYVMPWPKSLMKKWFEKNVK